jgi:PTS system ascorbate-specific IIA component
MIGVLIVAHAPLASAFLNVARHVFQSDPQQLEVIDVLPDQATAEIIERARQAVTRLNGGGGVLIMTDMAGGTPANCAQQLALRDQVVVLSGLSLPMLMRALTYRHESLSVVADVARTGAQQGAMMLEPTHDH